MKKISNLLNGLYEVFFVKEGETFEYYLFKLVQSKVMLLGALMILTAILVEYLYGYVSNSPFAVTVSAVLMSNSIWIAIKAIPIIRCSLFDKRYVQAERLFYYIFSLIYIIFMLYMIGRTLMV